ncbi:TPA_asm: adenain [Branchiostoma lancelet adintovirus]|uniref:Adenain n=1 Tax=Branchiostoma lancelet adintovirus TaxID=2597807 RepID=A0A5H3CJ76_9VIRU|nr:TPA_asm: adenain [Branchiostoma lancelet adintovirus]
MDTKQMYTVLESDENTAPIARGVFAADQLPTNVPEYPSAFVVNTDCSGKPGQHWLALYFDESMRGEFFDSYGRAPKDYPRSIELFLRRNSRLPWIRNERQIQSRWSTTCGQHCLFYLLHRCRRIPLMSIVDMFSRNLELNDVSVAQFIEEHFDIGVPVVDLSHIMSQVARTLEDVCRTLR